MFEIALVLVAGLIGAGFVFAYLSINLPEQHGALKLLFLGVSLLIITGGVVLTASFALSELAELNANETYSYEKFTSNYSELVYNYTNFSAPAPGILLDKKLLFPGLNEGILA